MQPEYTVRYQAVDGVEEQSATFPTLEEAQVFAQHEWALWYEITNEYCEVVDES